MTGHKEIDENIFDGAPQQFWKKMFFFTSENYVRNLKYGERFPPFLKCHSPHKKVPCKQLCKRSRTIAIILFTKKRSKERLRLSFNYLQLKARCPLWDLINVVKLLSFRESREKHFRSLLYKSLIIMKTNKY